MNTLEADRIVSVQELASMGVQDVAYVKAVMHEGNVAYAIHAADGRPLALVGSHDLAFATVRQNDLEPVSVH
jgi:hypothetical protein